MSTAEAEVKTDTKAQKRSEELQKLGGPALPQNNEQLAIPTRAAPDLALNSQGVAIRTLDDAWTFANIAFNSGLVPQTLKSPAQVLIALQMGMEVGLPPMAAIQNTAVINGRPSLWGDIMLALCRASGKFDEEAYEETWEGEGETLKAICTVRRLPNGKPIVREFSWADAKVAGLTTKAGDTYKHYPKRMLQMRARSIALRDGFPDVLKGVISAEEARDLEPREKNVTPVKPTTIEELQQTWQTPQEAAQTSEAATETAAPAEQPAKPEPGIAAGDSDDVLAKVGGELRFCKDVAAVNKVRNVFVGPASQLTELEKSVIEQACDMRIDEIKKSKKG